MHALPEPSHEARAHSDRLVALIRQEIQDAGGWISFARYMELALYAPGLGYYSAGAWKFGGAGDFITAPELTPLFGRTLAGFAANLLEHHGGAILELGAGSGRLALDMLLELERQGHPPDHYAILEVSPDLRQRQQELFHRQAPHLLSRLVWLDTLPSEFTGLILGNEVLDALPVHLLHRHNQRVWERGVELSGQGHFIWADRALPADLTIWGTYLPAMDDYLTEASPATVALIHSLATCLKKGSLLFIDYGFPRSEYYHPQRHRGTLMCHYRHHAFDDPFVLPGLVDITAHVDFTAVMDAAQEAGLGVTGYANQAKFLLDCGLLGHLDNINPHDPVQVREIAMVQKLLQPSEMGELFKTILLEK